MEYNKLIKLTDEEYFGLNAHNYSSIKNMLISAKHYKESLTTKVETTPALELGSAVHCAVLEPETFEEKYFVLKSKIDKRTKEYKQLIEDIGDKIVVTDVPIRIAEAIKEHGLDFSKTINEHAVIWEQESSAIKGLKSLFKAKIDAYDPETKTVYDLKTSVDISIVSFKRTVFNYSYYLQASHYINALISAGLDVNAYKIVAIEKEPPFDVVVYKLSPEYIAYGHSELKKLISQIETAETFDFWEGISSDEVTVELPEYLKA